MVEWKCTVQNPEGLHVRPVSKLVMKAVKFSSDIRVSLYQNSTGTESILEAMTLGTGENDKTLVRALSGDEREVLEAVKRVLAQENDLDP